MARPGAPDRRHGLLHAADARLPATAAVAAPALAVAATLADVRVGTWVYAALMPGDERAEITRLVREFQPVRDIELSQHVAVIGDTVAPFMAPPDTDTAALRAMDSLAILPADPAAAVEELQRRREEIGFSYFVFGADFAEAFAPVVAQLAGH